MHRFCSILLAALFLGGCATTPSSRTPPLLQKLAENGIDSRTYHKIANGRVLTYDDIAGLVKDNVPDQAIITYLQSTKAPYQFSNAQLQNLVQLGAGSDLVNYLGKSTGFFDASQRSQTGGSKWDKHSYFTDPYFYGAAPFPYAFPDEWYDPGVYNAWF